VNSKLLSAFLVMYLYTNLFQPIDRLIIAIVDAHYVNLMVQPIILLH